MFIIFKFSVPTQCRRNWNVELVKVICQLSGFSLQKHMKVYKQIKTIVYFLRQACNMFVVFFSFYFLSCSILDKQDLIKSYFLFWLVSGCIDKSEFPLRLFLFFIFFFIEIPFPQTWFAFILVVRNISVRFEHDNIQNCEYFYLFRDIFFTRFLTFLQMPLNYTGSIFTQLTSTSHWLTKWKI